MKSLDTDPVALKKLKSTLGVLSVHITETRKSRHIGDLFRGFKPGGAVVGDLVVLGEGTLTYETYDGVEGVGVVPVDGRKTDWLNPEKLYYCHEQTVELFFTPKKKRISKKVLRKELNNSAKELEPRFLQGEPYGLF